MLASPPKAGKIKVERNQKKIRIPAIHCKGPGSNLNANPNSKRISK